MVATYQRILEDLRSRIATGKLQPGEGLPSVRALARKWRVAPGTASRALQSLVQQGLARAMPRSGYRILGSLPVPREDLSPERIVRAAIKLADRIGLSALSVRGLAEELGTPPMSLYRHIENKDHLVWLMVDAVLGEEPLPDVARVSPRTGLERAARQEWKVLSRHPWLSRALNVSPPGAQPNALAFADRVMQVLESTGLTAEKKLILHIVLHAFIQGMAVNIEAEANARRETGIDEDAFMRDQERAFEEMATSGKFPFFAKMHRELSGGFELKLDAVFNRGLDALLTGFASSLKPRRR